MRIVLMGPPGAGKGTQAAVISTELNIPHISTGEIFRKNVGEGTELGQQAKEYMDKGEYVPDSVVNAMVADRLGQDDAAHGFLLDGYPRTAPQVAELKLIFVRPEFRGHGLGGHIVRELLGRARQAGYGTVRLEATTFMTSAIAMYESMGFERCLPWHGIPESFRPMTLFMEKHLD